MRPTIILLIAVGIILPACGPSPTATPTRFANDAIATETYIAAKIYATQTARAPVPTETRTPRATTAPAKPPATTPTRTQFPTRLAPQATSEASQCIHTSNLAPANWLVVLCESFTTDFNLWPTGDVVSTFAKGTKTVANGKYHWDLTANTDGVSRNFPDMELVSDFYLTAEMQMLRGPNDAWGALAFRWSQANSNVPSEQYLFEIRGDRRYRARLRYNDQYTTLVDWSPSGVLKSGVSNRLTVIAKGSHFDLYINEVKVGQFDDSQLKQGIAGLAIGLQRAGDHAIFEFDNFEVRAPQ